MMKKIISVLFSAIFLSTFVFILSAVAATNTGEGYAVYINGTFNAHNSMLVDGNLYSSNGNFIFDNAGSNVIKGNIDINSTATYSPLLKSSVEFSGVVTTHSSTTYDASVNEFSGVPEITNYVASKNYDWSGTSLDLSQSTHFGQLTVNNYLNVNTSAGDVTIVADTLTLSGSGYIKITGSGSLFLYVKNDLTVSNSCSINKDGSASKATIFALKKFTVDGAGIVNANVFMYSNNITFNGSGVLNGNLVSLASAISITGGGKINGVVFTPNADAKVFSSGEINGRLVANSLEIYGQGKIKYVPANGTVTIPPQAVKHSLNVVVSSPNAGTVTPASGSYNYGDTVTLSATPADGYQFKQFLVVSGSAPNQDGTVVIKDDTKITAVFEKIPTVNVPPYNKPVVIPTSAAYIFGRSDTDMQPHDIMHRGEASSVLYRLLKQNNLLGDFKYDPDAQPAFADLAVVADGKLKSRWDRSAFEFLTHIGIYKSDPTGYANLDAPMTRGEAFKMFSIALGLTKDTTLTLDQYTAIMIDAGYVEGFGDGGDMRIGENITRAQYCKIYNIITGRNTYGLIATDGTEVTPTTYGFTDITNDWAYGIILRATSAYNAAGQVDLAARGIRNVLDDYS
jgi:hypothetical protein